MTSATGTLSQGERGQGAMSPDKGSLEWSQTEDGNRILLVGSIVSSEKQK